MGATSATLTKIAEKLTAYKDWHSMDDTLGKHISLAVLEAEQEDF